MPKTRSGRRLLNEPHLTKNKTISHRRTRTSSWQMVLSSITPPYLFRLQKKEIPSFAFFFWLFFLLPNFARPCFKCSQTTISACTQRIYKSINPFESKDRTDLQTTDQKRECHCAQTCVRASVRACWQAWRSS